MKITIEHYEPDNDVPYDVETFEGISNFEYDSETLEIRFKLANGRVYFATYYHRINVLIV